MQNILTEQTDWFALFSMVVSWRIRTLPVKGMSERIGCGSASLIHHHGHLVRLCIFILQRQTDTNGQQRAFCSQSTLLPLLPVNFCMCGCREALSHSPQPALHPPGGIAELFMAVHLFSGDQRGKVWWKNEVCSERRSRCVWVDLQSTDWFCLLGNLKSILLNLTQFCYFFRRCYSLDCEKLKEVLLFLQ